MNAIVQKVNDRICVGLCIQQGKGWPISFELKAFHVFIDIGHDFHRNGDVIRIGPHANRF